MGGRERCDRSFRDVAIHPPVPLHGPVPDPAVDSVEIHPALPEPGLEQLPGARGHLCPFQASVRCFDAVSIEVRHP